MMKTAPLDYQEIVRKKTNNFSDGFTVIELLIATAVFSIVLMICAYAIVHVGRMYYKGVITSRTQDVSRKIVEDIAGAIQFGPRSDNFVRSDSGAGKETRCIGSVRYTFSTTEAQGAIAHALYKDVYTGNDCPANLDITQANPGGTNGESLLGRNMRIPELTVQPAGGNLWLVRVRLAYGDLPELFEDTDYRFCRGVNAGGQFCATSSFETNVLKRLL